MRHRLLPAALLSLLIACDGSSPAQSTQPTTTAVVNATTAAPPPPPPKEVKPSPAVLALLEPDPDLETTMTPEEIKATLEAASSGSNSAPSPTARVPNPSAGSADVSAEVQRLEERKDARDRDYRQRLESTTVYMGPDGMYHSRGCSTLIVRVAVTLPDGTPATRERFIGTATSLAAVRQQQTMAHGVCSPPADAEY